MSRIHVPTMGQVLCELDAASVAIFIVLVASLPELVVKRPCRHAEHSMDQIDMNEHHTIENCETRSAFPRVPFPVGRLCNMYNRFLLGLPHVSCRFCLRVQCCGIG